MERAMGAPSLILEEETSQYLKNMNALVENFRPWHWDAFPLSAEVEAPPPAVDEPTLAAG
jgi:hypothetical protein